MNRCHSSSHFLILINGFPRAVFPATRRPLSPFLFTLVADSFSLMTNKEKQEDSLVASVIFFFLFLFSGKRGIFLLKRKRSKSYPLS